MEASAGPSRSGRAAGRGRSAPDTAAFEALYRDHHAFLWRCALRLGVAEAHVADVLQETFLIAYRKFEDYDGRCRESTWLFGLLRNVARNFARGERRRRERYAAFGALHRDLHSQPEGATELLAARLLCDFLGTLEAARRELFVLVECEGMSGREAARALELNSNTAKVWLRCARREFETYFASEAHSASLASVGGPGALRRCRRGLEPPADAQRRGWPLLVTGLGAHGMVGVGAGSGAGVGLLSALGGKLAVFAGGLLMVGAVALGSVLSSPNEGEGEARAPSVEQAGAMRARGRRVPGGQWVPGVPGAADEVEAERPGELDSTGPAIVVQAGRAETRASRGSVQAGRPSASQDDPTEDLGALRAARRSLIAGRPEAALAQLTQAELGRRVPALAIAIEVGALCQLDDRDGARTAADRFRAAHPSEPISDRLVGLCWEL